MAIRSQISKASAIKEGSAKSDGMTLLWAAR
jgi:hypothetical protein